MNALTIVAGLFCASTSIAFAYGFSIMTGSARLPGADRSSSRRSARGAILLVGLSTGVLAAAYGFGHVAVLGWPSWSEWRHQPFWVAIAVGIYGVLRSPSRRTRLAAVVATVAIAGAVFWPCIPRIASGTTASLVVAVCLVPATYFAAESLVDLVPRVGRVEGPLILVLLAVTTGFACFESNHESFARLAGILGAVFLPVGFVGAVSGRPQTAASAYVFAAVWLSILAGGWMHPEESERGPAAAFLAIAMAPAATRVVDRLCLGVSHRWRSALRLVMFGAVLGGAAAYLYAGGLDVANSFESPSGWKN